MYSPIIPKQNKIKINLSSLDVALKKYKFIDFLKIDAEGADLEILKGGKNDQNHFGYIFNSSVRWDYSGSVYICCKIK